jgi:hypothetical protein
VTRFRCTNCEHEFDYDGWPNECPKCDHYHCGDDDCCYGGFRSVDDDPSEPEKNLGQKKRGQ